MNTTWLHIPHGRTARVVIGVEFGAWTALLGLCVIAVLQNPAGACDWEQVYDGPIAMSDPMLISGAILVLVTAIVAVWWQSRFYARIKDAVRLGVLVEGRTSACLQSADGPLQVICKVVAMAFALLFAMSVPIGMTMAACEAPGLWTQILMYVAGRAYRRRAIWLCAGDGSSAGCRSADRVSPDPWASRWRRRSGRAWILLFSPGIACRPAQPVYDGLGGVRVRK